jgi:hypothetical protein
MGDNKTCRIKKTIKGNVPKDKARGKRFVTNNMLEQRKEKE